MEEAPSTPCKILLDHLEILKDRIDPARCRESLFEMVDLVSISRPMVEKM